MNNKLKQLRAAFKVAQAKGVELKEVLKPNQNEKPDFVPCYVCGGLTSIIKAQYIGQGHYRHHSCEPGSSLWLKHRTKSLHYNFFKGGI